MSDANKNQHSPPPPAADDAVADGVYIPTHFVDAHHHFIDSATQDFYTFLKSFAPDLLYLPDQYAKDVVDNLAENAGITLTSSVHIEAMPDTGAAEVAWLESMDESSPTTIKAIVGSVNLASDSAADEILALKQASNKVHGVRWMLDCVGKFDGGKTATHIATTRHDGIDYLRGSAGGYDGTTVAAFEAGYRLLAEHDLTFDLQCAPAQLEQAAVLAARHPEIPVVIDHLGKPRMVGAPDAVESELKLDTAEIQQWRSGMRAMAALPHVYVKISMLGYIVPGWHLSVRKERVVRDLVRETVAMFGPERCMLATNWWASAAAADSDFLAKEGPTPTQLLTKIATWLHDYSHEDLDRMFAGTAKEFYRI